MTIHHRRCMEELLDMMNKVVLLELEVGSLV